MAGTANSPLFFADEITIAVEEPAPSFVEQTHRYLRPPSVLTLTLLYPSVDVAHSLRPLEVGSADAKTSSEFVGINNPIPQMTHGEPHGVLIHQLGNKRGAETNTITPCRNIRVRQSASRQCLGLNGQAVRVGGSLGCQRRVAGKRESEPRLGADVRKEFQFPMSDAAERSTMPVDGSTLGTLCEITGRRVRQLVTEGVFPKADSGKFDAFVCVPAYYRWKSREDRRANEAGDLDPVQERARKDRALAISTEIKNDLAKGRVVLIDDAIAIMTGSLAVVRNKILGLASRVAPRLVMQRAAEPVRAILYDEIVLILQELSSEHELQRLAHLSGR